MAVTKIPATPTPRPERSAGVLPDDLVEETATVKPTITV